MNPFEILPGCENLTKTEIKDLTGSATAKDQIAWLEKNLWEYAVKKSGEPVISRLYYRLRLCGINPSSGLVKHWEPDFSRM